MGVFTVSTLPLNPSESTKKLNPHIYGDMDKAAAYQHPELIKAIIPAIPEDRLNKTEREFLGRLRADVYGKMQHIGIQSITLQLGFDCRYTSDFWTRMAMGDFRFWEVKGFMRDDARVKLHTAARMFPFWTFVLVQKVKGEWQERIIEQ